MRALINSGNGDLRNWQSITPKKKFNEQLKLSVEMMGRKLSRIKFMEAVTTPL